MLAACSVNPNHCCGFGADAAQGDHATTLPAERHRRPGARAASAAARPRPGPRLHTPPAAPGRRPSCRQQNRCLLLAGAEQHFIRTLASQVATFHCRCHKPAVHIWVYYEVCRFSELLPSEGCVDGCVRQVCGVIRRLQRVKLLSRQRHKRQHRHPSDTGCRAVAQLRCTILCRCNRRS